jgi:hypothetical protein
VDSGPKQMPYGGTSRFSLDPSVGQLFLSFWSSVVRVYVVHRNISFLELAR